MKTCLMSVSLHGMTHVDFKQFMISSECLIFHNEIVVKIILSYYANKLHLIRERLKAVTYPYISLTKVTIFQRFAEFRSYSFMLSPIKCVK
jgi:hypothetical protein